MSSTPIQTPYYPLGSTEITIAVEPVRSALFSGCGDDIHKSIGSFLDPNSLAAYGKTSKYAYKIVLGNTIEEALAEQIANRHHKKFTLIMNSIVVLPTPLAISSIVMAFINGNTGAALIYQFTFGVNFFSTVVNFFVNSRNTVQKFNDSSGVLRIVAVFGNFAAGGLNLLLRTLANSALFSTKKMNAPASPEDYSYVSAYIFLLHGTILLTRTLISRKRILKLYMPTQILQKRPPNLCQRISSAFSSCFRRCFS